MSAALRLGAIRDAIATCEVRIAEERSAIAFLEPRGASFDLRFARSELAHQEALVGRLKARHQELKPGAPFQATRPAANR